MANPNPVQLGLTPIRSGQVLIPSGRNQYTYCDEAERNLDRWLRQKYGDHTNSEAIDRSESNLNPLNNGSHESMWTGTSYDGTGRANDELGAADGGSIRSMAS